MRFVIEQGPVWATIREGSLKLADRLLCIPDPNAMHMPSARLHLWDGLHHFVERPEGRLPAGLLPRLARRLENRGHEVEIVRKDALPQLPMPPSDCLEGIDLREHQVDGLDLGLESRRGLFWHATGAGKGDVIVALSKVAVDAGIRVLVIVPSLGILGELRKRFKERLSASRYRPGIFGDGTRVDGAIVIGTYQTLGRRDRLCDKVVSTCGMVLVDEVQHAGSKAYHALLKRCVSADYRFGFSGSVSKLTKLTDERSVERSKDKARMHRWNEEAFVGPVIHRVTNAYMIEKGYSAQPRVVIVDDRAAFGDEVPTPRPTELPDGTTVPVPNLYGQVFEKAAIEDRVWLRTIARTIAILIETGRPPFVFSHSVEHLKAIKAVCDKREVPVKLLCGDNTTTQRDRVLAEYGQGGQFAVLSSPIFDEGISINGIRAVVLAGARRAIVELLQRVGRGVRKKADDNTVVVVDFYPHHSPMLVDQARERIAVYESEGFPVTRVNDVHRLAEFL